MEVHQRHSQLSEGSSGPLGGLGRLGTSSCCVYFTQVFARIMRPRCCGHTDEPTITLRTRRHIVVAFIKELEDAPWARPRKSCSLGAGGPRPRRQALSSQLAESEARSAQHDDRPYSALSLRRHGRSRPFSFEEFLVSSDRNFLFPCRRSALQLRRRESTSSVSCTKSPASCASLI